MQPSQISLLVTATHTSILLYVGLAFACCSNSEGNTATSSESEGHSDSEDSGYEQRYTAVCEKYYECGKITDLASCFEDCGLGEDITTTKECSALWADWHECIGTARCQELDDGLCATKKSAIEEGGCLCSGAGSPGEEMCYVESKCPDQPVRRIECTAESCTCLIDGEPVKTCPEGKCEDSKPNLNCCDSL